MCCQQHNDCVHNTHFKIVYHIYIYICYAGATQRQLNISTMWTHMRDIFIYSLRACCAILIFKRRVVHVWIFKSKPRRALQCCAYPSCCLFQMHTNAFTFMWCMYIVQKHFCCLLFEIRNSDRTQQSKHMYVHEVTACKVYDYNIRQRYIYKSNYRKTKC